MLANEDPLDPPAIEDSKCQIASNLADNFIPTQLILLMNIPSAIIHSQHDTVNLVDSSEVLIPGPKCFTSRPLFEGFYRVTTQLHILWAGVCFFKTFGNYIVVSVVRLHNS